jgi:hypothetical protein
MWRTYNPFGSPFAGTEKEFSTMKIIHWAIVFGLLGVAFCGRALADEDSSWPVRQQTAVQPAATEYDSFFHPAWQEETGESPSDQPRPQAAQSPPEEAGCREACGTCRGRLCGRDPCGCGCDDPWGLPQPRFLASRGIKLGGWLDVGISAVANDPADRFNGVVTFDDRDGEAQMNQLWLYLNREVDTGGYGWGWGGRVDFVYGTDAFFTQCADGLEANWHQTERFYQAALPQFYVDVGYNDWTIRMGHFFTIIGYEVVQAPENFFYSHAYTHQYGEPFTHFGLLAMYKVNDQWSLSGGFTRGWDNLDDTIGKNSLGLLGGANWTSWNDRLELRFAITASEEGPLNADRTMYSLVGIWHVTDDLTYVVQHDYGQDVVPGLTKAEWYGLNQYLLYEINPRWAAGLRGEWFRDQDGTRVTGARPTNALHGASFPGSFYEITAGLDWKPRQNILVRPEVRWDWYDASGPVQQLPFDSGDRASQFLFAIDMIVTY